MITSSTALTTYLRKALLRLYYFLLHLSPTIEEEEDLTCTSLLANNISLRS